MEASNRLNLYTILFAYSWRVRKSSAAFLGSCFSSQELCYRLLQYFSGGPDVFPSIPDQDIATSILLPLINSDSLPDLIHPA